MKLLNLSAVNIITKESYNFSFDRTGSVTSVNTGRASQLYKLLCYLFLDGKFDNNFTVNAEFEIQEKRFTAKKSLEEGATKLVLKQVVDGKARIVSKDKNVVKYLENLLGGKLKQILENCYMTGNSLKKFFASGKLYDVAMAVKVFGAENLGKPDDKSPALVLAPVVTKKDIDSTNKNIANAQNQLVEAEKRYAELDSQSKDTMPIQLREDLAKNKQQYKRLLENSDFIENKRKQIDQYEKVLKLIPQLQSLEGLKADCVEMFNDRQNAQKEVDWFTNEQKAVVKQLELKQNQLAENTARRVRIESVRFEMSRANQLKLTNKELNDNLLKLKEQVDRLNAQKVTLKSALDSVESSINEVRAEMSGLSVPQKALGEMMESLRLTVKLDELESQMERLRSDITVKEAQISEKETALTAQNKTLRSVLEIDQTISPLKARETIVSVINAKSKKLKVINDSLKVKQTNLQRALEGYNYELMEISQAEEALSNELSATKIRKAEEYKRQVLLNSQKTYLDVTAVYAVDSNLDDVEVQNLAEQLENRRLDKQERLFNIARLTGALEEIKRHVDINEADISALNEQKDNIVKRYNQLINENNNETVYNYVKALETDRGTKYLLDVQQSTVISQTEVNDLKQYVDQTKTRLSELYSRYKRLSDEKHAIDSESGTFEAMLHNNEQTKSELADFTTRLSANYEKHKAMLVKVDEVDSKIYRVQELIVETLKTIKLNERDIAIANEKAEQLAGGNIEKLVSKAFYEASDIEAESKMLSSSKSQIELDLFNKKVNLAKLEWLYDGKKKQYEEFKQGLKQQFAEHKIDNEWIESIADLEDENILQLKKAINGYDKAKMTLEGKINNMTEILKDKPTADEYKKMPDRLKSIKQEIADIKSEIERLQVLSDTQLTQYLRGDTQQIVKEQEVVDALEAKEEFKQFIAYASTYLNKLVDKLSLTYGNGELAITSDGYAVKFEELSAEQKIYLYFAIVFALPVSKVSVPLCVVDDKFGLDKQQLGAALSLIDKNFVTAVEYKKAKEIEKDVS